MIMQFDLQRLVAALLAAATALFLIAGRVSGRHRRAAMAAAIAAYGAVLAGVVVYAGLWLLGIAG